MSSGAIYPRPETRWLFSRIMVIRTMPFDMCVMTGLDRFHLFLNVVNRVPKLEAAQAHLRQEVKEKLMEHKEYVRKYG